MGRKRTAEEYHAAAIANGWVEGAHAEEDRVVLTKAKPSRKYTGEQDRALNLWKIFLSPKGTSTTELLGEGYPLPSNVKIKDFARWYCSSCKGRLTDQPNDISVRNTLKKFFAGFKRVTKTEIPKELRVDVYTFIDETLVEQGFTHTKRRPRDLFDDSDLLNFIISLWTDNDPVFIHETMRTQMTFITEAYCFSGARIGAFLDGGTCVVEENGKKVKMLFKGLTWRDVHIFLFPLPDGTAEVILKITQRWVKGNKDPENHVSEITAYEHALLRYDPTAFLLPLAFRDRVLPGIESLAQLWEQRVPEGLPQLELQKDPSKLDLPVLRIVTRHGGLSNKMLDESTFRYYFQQMVRNAGYYGVVTIHALRRALANAVDKIATAGERNKILGWASSDVCNNKYISDICGVDGQAAFLHETPRFDHIKKLRSASTKRAPGLPKSLPAEQMQLFLNDPGARQLHSNLCKLRSAGASREAINEADRKFRTYTHWLKNRRLEAWRAEWLEVRYNTIIQTRGQMSKGLSTAASHAQTLFRVLPERARLAAMINSTEPRTREQKLQAVEDLFSLCTRDYEVMYRPGENPIDGACPVCRGELPKEKPRRSTHIHACRRRELTAARPQYCYLCFKWFDGPSAWEAHCRGHLDSMTPLWCAMRTYCHTLISPGLCPFCMVNPRLSAAQALKQWVQNEPLMIHVEEHIDEVPSWPNACPCRVEVEDATRLRHHLSDFHGLWKMEWRTFGPERPLMEAEDGDPVDTASKPDPDDAAEPSRRKRSKPTTSGGKFLHWSPPHHRQSPNPSMSKPAFIEWSPPSSLKPRDAPSERDRDDFVSNMALSGSEGRDPDGQMLPEPLSQPFPPVDDDGAGYFIDATFWRDDVNEMNGLIESGPSVSTPITGVFSEPSETLSDQALSSEGSWKSQSAPQGSEEDVANTLGVDSLENMYLSEPCSTPDKQRPSSASLHAPVDQEFLDHEPNIAALSTTSLTTKCSACRADAYKSSRSRNKRFNECQQMSFCKTHRLEAAQTEWARRGYPRISWRNLYSRFGRLTSTLRGILGAKPPSRRSTEGSAAARKERYMYRRLQSATAGYYGPRGKRIMTEYIIAEFGTGLSHERSRGQAMCCALTDAYILAILVPELAVRLIMEDMRTCERRARQILRESAEIGETLNEDF